ncbi:MAG: hypothetical protein GVY18_06285, partial [Bacteroidetes bacterium]|nr:hypothetical protein [Bacteroidota bacterium]
DTTLGLGFVYNGDNFDEGSAGYQDRPPALGYDFFQGPLVNTNGIDDDGDGEVDEADERLRMTRFVYYNNDSSPQGNPADADDFFGYLRGRWKDGSRMTVGGDGFGDDLGLGPTNFMFTGNPPEFWSEDNIDGQGTSNVPADRRFLMSTGPFTMNPGDVQELVFGIVWSQTANRIGSVAQLKIDDILAQGAFNFDFDLPRPPDAPTVEAAALDQEIVLKWDYPSNSNNYLNSYNEKSPFLTDPNVQDTTFTFEGYKVYQYASPQDFPNNGEVIATLDEVNNITAITREAVDPATGAPIVEVAAEGTDAGVQNYLQISQDFLSDQPLNNNTEYYYGVQAYAYNGFSDPPIYQSPISGDPDGGPLVAVPRLTNPRDGGTTLNAQPNVNPDDFDVPGEIDKLADAIIGAEIADPLEVTGDTYELQFYRFDPDGEEGEVAEFLTYDLVNASTGETLVNGREFYANKGQPLPIGTSASPAQGQDVILAEGLTGSVRDTPAAIAGGGAGIVEVAWAGTPVTPDQYDAGGAIYNGNTVWHSLNTTADYYASSGGTGLVSRLERYAEFAAPRDFEMRFTEAGGYCTYSFEDDKIATTPFEIWDIGIGTPDDPSDDARMIPFCLSNDGETKDAWGFGVGEEPFFGFPGSDWVYWMDPLPGTAGYEGYANAIEQSGGAGATYNFDFDDSGSYFANFYGGFVYPIGRFMVADFAGDATPPPPGTTIRVVTTKPIQDGDVFTLETQQFAPQRDQADVLEASLDEITLVPNPYRGSSSYDVSNFQSEVRVTNLPERATVRIYTLSGTLIRTLDKVPGTDFLRWDLRTEEGLPIASGIYLVHVNVPDVGERVLKFGVVSPRIQLDVF